MADNSEIAASLRTLADAADSDMAQHDINTLADALDSIDGGVLDKRDAIGFIEEHNDFQFGAVIDSENNTDVDSDLYVYEPETPPSYVITPDGWEATVEHDGEGIGFSPK